MASLSLLLSGVVDKHGDTLQNLAMLAYLKRGEEARPALQAVLTAKVCTDIYKHLSKEDEVEAARQETLLSIAKFVKEHPRAKPNEIQHKVEEEIALFKLKIQKL